MEFSLITFTYQNGCIEIRDEAKLISKGCSEQHLILGANARRELDNNGYTKVEASQKGIKKIAYQRCN